MVRVPGSSGDSGFHRESQGEVQVKIQGNEMSSDARSTTTSLNAKSADRRNLEEKSHPPQVSGKETPADPDSRQDPLTKQTKITPDLAGLKKI
ncbi:hypothetical protein PHMEG_0004181 [Phytophthora megakarya]|uniref:Uncharacterized protein n=1 Tax=Phytophthora megakarya TaxID=4795 RepID=A0A225WUH3_9STRA|nr:hypothetical protein PHMEG_0004181 [Phytophthora megakarya]